MSRTAQGFRGEKKAGIGAFSSPRARFAPSPFNQRGFDQAISSQYPGNAINFLRRNPVPCPLYNNLNWGGFLMWYMPDYCVAIKGRNDLYGDELDRTFFLNSQNSDTS
jgi:hypothetical protein